MVQYKITYFDNGLGEIPKLILLYGGADFVDNRITPEEWSKIKANSPTGRLPILEVDEKELTDSGAINRYLAVKFNLRPKDDWENAQMEAFIDSYRDFITEIKEWLRAAATTVAAVAADDNQVESDKINKLYKVIYEPAANLIFTRLTDIISRSSSGFLANSGLSWGDIFLAETILTLRNFDSELEKKFLKIIEYQEHVHNHDKIKPFVTKRNKFMIY